ncbi:hypothetical protein GALL_456490 [mine drainage metagenome]|uniref:DUF2934 domain-containing protein n=1 Tax=mine drainage metagenome TaxID=410659 RepID=A0A1J5PPJ5_9ZZZZ
MVTNPKKPGSPATVDKTAKAASSKPVAAQKPAAASSAALADKPAPKASAKTRPPRVAAKKVAAPAPAPAAPPTLSEEQCKHYISVAAFYIAERRGFAPGNPMDDWVAAEAEVKRLIASGHFAI